MSLKVIEALAEAAAESAAKNLPSKLLGAAESLTGKSGVSKLGKSGSLEANPAAAEILGNMQLTDSSARFAFLAKPQADIARANESLLEHITRLMPQVQGGKLDWILGGSAAVNALAVSRNITLLEASRLPSIVPGQVIAMPDRALSSYGNFVRKVGDVDAFVVNNGENAFLKSPYLVAAESTLPQSAEGALTAVGEYRTSKLVQAVKMEFDHPEIAALEYAGKTVYVTAPGQLVGNKLRQVLLQYAPADARKTTGDFNHLLEAASAIYPEQSLLKFGRQALERNELLYKRELTVPWDRSADNSTYLTFLRKVLESEERNGMFLKGLKVDDTKSIAAMRLFEKHTAPADKAAIAGFMNRHGDFVAKLDAKGSEERASFLAQGGAGKASDMFMNLMDSLPARQNTRAANQLKQTLKEMDLQLTQDANLPDLARRIIRRER